MFFIKFSNISPQINPLSQDATVQESILCQLDQTLVPEALQVLFFYKIFEYKPINQTAQSRYTFKKVYSMIAWPNTAP